MALQNLTMLAVGVADAAKKARTDAITAANTEVLTKVKEEVVAEAISDALSGAELTDLALKSEVEAVKAQAETNASSIDTINSTITDLTTTVGQKANAADVYTKSEVDDKLAAIPKFGIEVVETLPAVADAKEDKVYLVRTSNLLGSDNIFTEYILVNGAFEELGTQKLDLSGFATKEDLEAYVLNSDIFTNGYFQTTYNHADGSYAKLWNESDGGGSQYFNKGADVISYVGTNDGDEKATAIDVQIYSKVKTSNSGVRINVNPQKAYYTKGANTTANGGSEDNELAVLGDIKMALNDYVKTADANLKYVDYTTLNGRGYQTTTDADNKYVTKTTYGSLEDDVNEIKLNYIDSSYVDNALKNYYKQSQLYTKAEVDEAINKAIASVLTQVRAELSGTPVVDLDGDSEPDDEF